MSLKSHPRLFKPMKFQTIPNILLQNIRYLCTFSNIFHLANYKGIKLKVDPLRLSTIHNNSHKIIFLYHLYGFVYTLTFNIYAHILYEKLHCNSLMVTKSPFLKFPPVKQIKRTFRIHKLNNVFRSLSVWKCIFRHSNLLQYS